MDYNQSESATSMLALSFVIISIRACKHILFIYRLFYDHLPRQRHLNTEESEKVKSLLRVEANKSTAAH